MNNESLGERLLMAAAAPVLWEKGNDKKVVNVIETAIDRSLTLEEIEIVKIAWCHGFSAYPEDVFKTAGEHPKGEKGSTDD